jgi:hypothetical protein
MKLFFIFFLVVQTNAFAGQWNPNSIHVFEGKLSSDSKKTCRLVIEPTASEFQLKLEIDGKMEAFLGRYPKSELDQVFHNEGRQKLEADQGAAMSRIRASGGDDSSELLKTWKRTIHISIDSKESVTIKHYTVAVAAPVISNYTQPAESTIAEFNWGGVFIPTSIDVVKSKWNGRTSSAMLNNYTYDRTVLSCILGPENSTSPNPTAPPPPTRAGA